MQDDHHLLTVLRYVEANTLRADLVERAEDWPFSSAAARENHLPIPLAPWPVDRPDNWLELLNQPPEESTLAELLQSVCRGKPFGCREWVQRIADALGLSCSLRPRGRPTKVKNPVAEVVIEG